MIGAPAAPRTTAPAAVTLGLAAVSWAVAIHQMDGMGSVSGLGSLTFFVGLWVTMMAAMMLPGAVPTVVAHARAGGGIAATPRFIGSYLTVWALVGLAIYAVYRAHGPVVSGAVVIAAGVYELTPLKQAFRRRCQDRARSGWAFGLCCAGSSIGLMLLLVAIGLMSVAWMSLVAVIVIGQKLLPPKSAIDVPLGLAIVGLGMLIVVAPGTVPGLTLPM